MILSQNDVMGLAILKKLEEFRVKLETGEIQAGCPDWIVRVCEACVADYTQFKTRADWVAEIKGGN